MDLAKRKNITTDENLMRHPIKLAQWFFTKQILNKETVEFFKKLRILRNEAVHYKDMSLTKEDALQYINQCQQLSTYLSNIK